MLPVKLSFSQKYQNNSKEDWKDATIEKRGDMTIKVTENGKIIITSASQEDLMSCRYNNLKHPSRDWTHLAIKQHFC